MGERTDADWMRLHVETLFTTNDQGDLLLVNESHGKAAPSFFIGHVADGTRLWFGSDVSDEVRASLRDLAGVAHVGPITTPNPHHEELSEAVAEMLDVSHHWAGPTFRFPETLPAPAAAVSVTPDTARVLRRYFPDWLDDAELGRPFSAVLEGRDAVAICTSVRIGRDVDEGGVETHERFRGKGHGTRAIAHWAASVRAVGREPLYSTSWSNEASRAVAKRLGMISYGHTLHWT